MRAKVHKGRCDGIQGDGAGARLCFGKYGLASKEAGRISYNAIEAARRVMSRKFRRHGRIWLRVVAQTPITSKPTEVRMGKGKGNPTGCIAKVKAGQVLFEVDGVSEPLAQEAARLASHRIRLATRFIQWS